MKCHKLFYVINVIFVTTLLVCCTSRRKDIINDVKELSGKCLHLPVLHDSIKESNYSSLIVVYIDAEGCNPCKLKTIYKWKAMQRELDKLQSQDSIICKMLFITEPGYKIEEAKKVVEVFYHDANVIYDTTEYFKKHNKLPKDNRLHIFLLNKKSEIVVIGSPLISEEMMKFYNIQIKKLHNE